VDLKPVRSEQFVSLAAAHEGHDLDHVALFDRNRFAFVAADNSPISFDSNTIERQLKLAKKGVD
jgi:hypothetical protein